MLFRYEIEISNRFRGAIGTTFFLVRSFEEIDLLCLFDHAFLLPF